MSTVKITRPNIKNHIAIYYNDTLTTETLKDKAIQELVDLCGSYNFAINYTYAIYSDHSFISENIFIPIFHSYYLNSDPKIVILRDPEKSIDIIELYQHHRYYIYKDQENSDSILQKLKQLFPKHHIESINSIKDII